MIIILKTWACAPISLFTHTDPLNKKEEQIFEFFPLQLDTEAHTGALLYLFESLTNNKRNTKGTYFLTKK